jgi:hypothetical protein
MIQQGQCNIFKKNVYDGAENFSATSPYTYKIALYTASADLNADTLVYTTTNEVTGTGYTAGGQALTVIPAQLDGSTVIVSFDNVTWAGSGFTARCALIYNGTTNAAVAVLDFGSDKTSANFTITFPAATATTAIIRYS